MRIEDVMTRSCDPESLFRAFGEALRPIQIDRFDSAAPGIIADHIRKARRELLGAMAVADKYSELDLHRQIGFSILALDDLRDSMEEGSTE